MKYKLVDTASVSYIVFVELHSTAFNVFECLIRLFAQFAKFEHIHDTLESVLRKTRKVLLLWILPLTHNGYFAEQVYTYVEDFHSNRFHLNLQFSQHMIRDILMTVIPTARLNQLKCKQLIKSSWVGFEVCMWQIYIYIYRSAA